MARDLTQLELLTELEPVVATNIYRHLATAKDWNPHDYVPWDE
ncbi:acyl-ACP desaturase, partial [Nocardia farcinica]